MSVGAAGGLYLRIFTPFFSNCVSTSALAGIWEMLRLLSAGNSSSGEMSTTFVRLRDTLFSKFFNNSVARVGPLPIPGQPKGSGCVILR